MNVDHLVDRAFELALFIHGDHRATVLAVVREAFHRYPSTYAIELRHTREYDPKERRAKVPLEDEQLLQWLVLHVSEKQEQAEEEAGDLLSDDLTLRYIKQIAKWSLAHNSFYACVGVLRVLCAFETGEALQAYENVNGPAKDDAESRRIKKKSVAVLLKRFGQRLKTVTTVHGEQRFDGRSPTVAEIEFVFECLRRFTPWGTRHVIPAALPPSGQYPALPLRGQNARDDGAIERGRIHAFLEPQCCGRLLGHVPASARLEERLMIPKHSAATGHSPRNRTGPPPDEKECEEILVATGRGARRRLRRAIKGPVRLRVDGKERSELPDPHSGSFEVVVPADTEVVELVGTDDSRDVVVATYALIDEDPSTDDRVVVLEWPRLDEPEAVPVEHSDALFVGLERLASLPTLADLRERLRHWMD